MKDMFLAEELGYDPYEPYPPDESLNELSEKDFLTEDDFKKQDSTLKISGIRWICDNRDCRASVGRFSLCDNYFKCNGCDTIFQVK